MNTEERTPQYDARTMASLEEGVCITAGSLNTTAFYRRVERQRAQSHAKGSPLMTIFGIFLNRARRERSLTLEQLAELTGADALELLQVEEGLAAPEPRVVSRLARTLQVPPGRLMQLAGHVQTLDASLATAAYAFATRSNSKPLEPEEREALHEFVKALAAD